MENQVKILIRGSSMICNGQSTHLANYPELSLLIICFIIMLLPIALLINPYRFIREYLYRHKTKTKPNDDYFFSCRCPEDNCERHPYMMNLQPEHRPGRECSLCKWSDPDCYAYVGGFCSCD